MKMNKILAVQTTSSFCSRKSGLTLTDLHRGWTECAALTVRAPSLVVAGISAVTQGLPFTLRGLATDNDRALMNETWQHYCQQHRIEWTRWRVYRKNDQARVAQRRGSPFSRSTPVQTTTIIAE
jgi:hypothetical protein